MLSDVDADWLGRASGRACAAADERAWHRLPLDGRTTAQSDISHRW